MQADKLSSIGLLAAGVAHEVNTPLAVISTYAQMLAKQVTGDEQKSKLLEKIAKQTFRASEIVNSLLNFSRTSTTEFGDVDVNRVIQRDAVSLIEHQLQKAGVEVQVELDWTTRRPIKGNAGKLQQVFLNLFLNARDAMDRRRRARSHAPGATASARASKSPIPAQGIAPGASSAASTIRSSPPRAPKKGTGLGLSVTLRHHAGAWRHHRSGQPALAAGHALPPGTSVGLALRKSTRSGNRRHIRSIATATVANRSDPMPDRFPPE